MGMYDIIAQIFGVIGMAVMVVSFQAKKQKTVLHAISNWQKASKQEYCNKNSGILIGSTKTTSAHTETKLSIIKSIEIWESDTSII